MAGDVRHPVTVRLDKEDKETFFEAAEGVGLEPGTAARQLVELVCQRLRAGSDLLDVLKLLKQKPVVRVPAASSANGSATDMGLRAIADPTTEHES